jgi:hypothetical protein
VEGPDASGQIGSGEGGPSTAGPSTPEPSADGNAPAGSGDSSGSGDSGNSPDDTEEPKGKSWSEKFQEKLPYIAFNASLGWTGSIANDLIHGERNPVRIVEDGLIGAATESIGGLGGKAATTIGFDALGNGLNNLVSQGVDQGWNNIDAGQIPFSMALGGGVGAFGYVGTIAEIPALTRGFGQRGGETLAYNFVYGVADLGASACNIYGMVIESKRC